jgi:Brix domain
MAKKNQAARRRQQEEGREDPKAANQKEEEVEEEMKRAGEEESEEENEALEQAQQDDDDDDKEEEEEEHEEEEDQKEGDEEGEKDANFRAQPVVPAASLMINSDGKYRNKQRCLVLCSRGVTARFRHLMEDLRTLLPHHKKESKLDPGKGGMGRAVNDIAAMRGCNSVLFLECRKRRDCYMWLGHVGSGGSGSNNSSSITYTDGPSVKFHVTNVHTMDELRLTGNCMKGSRPILTFDQSFEKIGHLKLIKELFVDVFGTPRGHPKSKPFVDRIMAFYHADKRVSTV